MAREKRIILNSGESEIIVLNRFFLKQDWGNTTIAGTEGRTMAGIIVVLMIQGLL
jgi:hypothetical protein